MAISRTDGVVVSDAWEGEEMMDVILWMVGVYVVGALITAFLMGVKDGKNWMMDEANPMILAFWPIFLLLVLPVVLCAELGAWAAKKRGK